MKKNLEILESEHKITKAGKPFMRFKTSEGWMSCFDDKEAKKLKEFEGKTASVELIESGDFKNIKKCYGEASDEDKDEVEVIKPGIQAKTAQNGSNGQTAMYASYAKDVFCALQPSGTIGNAEVNMQTAIELVKQAKEAFE